MEHSLLDKCLDFTRDMVMIGQSFTLKLNLGSDLNFSFEYHEKMNPTILEEPNIQSKTKMNVMKARKKVSPSTKKKNAIRREDFIKLKSENCSSKATAEVSDEIPKANNNDNYDVFECDKCTYRTRLNKNMQDHIKTKHQSMNTDDFEESYNDSTEVYEIQSHIETEDISECKNDICQEIQNLCKDPDLCFCEFDP